MPSALLGRWQIGSNVSGTAHIDYDDSGYWRIVIMVDGMSPAARRRRSILRPANAFRIRAGDQPLACRFRNAIPIRDHRRDAHDRQLLQRRSIDKSTFAELLADMRASAALTIARIASSV